MFLRDKLCQKKIFIPCLLFSLFLSFLFCVSFSASVSAVSLTTNHFDLNYTSAMATDGLTETGMAINQRTSLFVKKGNWFEVTFNSVNVTANYAHIHFEPNIVFEQALNQAYWGNFVNSSYYQVSSCWSSVGSPTTVQRNVSDHITDWSDSDSKNKTLTLYFDIVLSNMTNGNQTITCGFNASSGRPFFENSSTTNFGKLYFEQNPASISFEQNEQDALMRAQNSILSSIEDGNQRRWETEREEQDAKEEELTDQADSLSLSATVTDNPFTSLFTNFISNNNPCYTLTRIPALFNSSSWTICSPYPATVRNIFSVVTNLFALGLIIRLYYKKLKGGVDG